MAPRKWPEQEPDTGRLNRDATSQRGNNFTNGSNSAMARPTIEQVIEAVESEDYIGFCLSCGEEAYEVEPDARKYKCESCGEYRVFGAEEILIMGAFDDDSEE